MTDRFKAVRERLEGGKVSAGEASAKWTETLRLTFGTEHGQKVLEALKRDILDQRSFDPDPLVMAYKEGERGIIRDIIDAYEGKL